MSVLECHSLSPMCVFQCLFLNFFFFFKTGNKNNYPQNVFGFVKLCAWERERESEPPLLYLFWLNNSWVFRCLVYKKTKFMYKMNDSVNKDVHNLTLPSPPSPHTLPNSFSPPNLTKCLTLLGASFVENIISTPPNLTPPLPRLHHLIAWSFFPHFPPMLICVAFSFLSP